jgi:hypothetical protein
MTATQGEANKALVPEAFDTLFNRRDYTAAAGQDAKGSETTVSGRDPNDDIEPTSTSILHVDRATQAKYYPLDNSQSQACALALGLATAKEWLEQLLKIALGHTWAAVLDSDNRVFAFTKNSNIYAPTRRRIANRVVN